MLITLLTIAIVAFLVYAIWNTAFNNFGPNTPYKKSRSHITLRDGTKIESVTYRYPVEFAVTRRDLEIAGYEIINLDCIRTLMECHHRGLRLGSRIIFYDTQPKGGKICTLDVEYDPKAKDGKSFRLSPVTHHDDIHFSQIFVMKTPKERPKQKIEVAA